MLLCQMVLSGSLLRVPREVRQDLMIHIRPLFGVHAAGVPQLLQCKSLQLLKGEFLWWSRLGAQVGNMAVVTSIPLAHPETA